MIADLQDELAKVKARAAAKPSAPPATPSPARRRRSQQPTSFSTETAPAPLINTLRAEIQSCVDAFSVDLVDLIQRSTLDAVQRVLQEAAAQGGSATDNEPEFTPVLPRTPARSSKSAIPLSFRHYERMAIERALAERGGNAIEAGKLLGLTRSSIYRRIKAHGIQPSARGGRFEVSPHDPVARNGEPASLDAYEKAAIVRAIDESGGKILAAARALRVGRSTLYRRMEALGIPTQAG